MESITNKQLYKMTISNYKTAADNINWQNQKEMYQQGHEFFLNYYQLYADNKNNDIGEFLDLHYNLVANYKGGKIKADANYGDLAEKAQKKINFLQRNLVAMTEEQAISARKKVNFLQRVISK